MKKDWQFLIDSYTGKGGFQDGSYLVKYERNLRFIQTTPKR